MPGAHVTSKRVVLQNVTYPTANITSVSMVKDGSDAAVAQLIAICLFGVGLVFVLGVLALLSQDDSDMRPVGGLVASDLRPFGWLGAAVGLFLMALGAFAYFNPVRATWVVVLGSAGGERHALSTFDSRIAQAVVDAINCAVVARV